MKNLFIKFYELLTAPIYRRLMRDMTLQIQDISQSYVDQHERLTAKLLDEIVRLNIRVEHAEGRVIAKDKAFEQLEQAIDEPGALSADDIWDLMKDATKTIDVVEICARHNLSLGLFFELEQKYRGLEGPGIRRMKLLEDTNIELRSLIAKLMRQQNMTMDGLRELDEPNRLKEKVTNGNGRE